MKNLEFRTVAGVSLQYTAAVNDEKFLYIFGSGYQWCVEVSTFMDPKSGRYKCEVYYTTTASKHKYYLIEFYIDDLMELKPMADRMIAEAWSMVDMDRIIEDIERDVEEAWEMVEG